MIVTVTTWGMGVGVVNGPVACSAEVSEQVDLVRAVVVACSSDAVDQLDSGATAVVASTAVVEQVESTTSSLQPSQFQESAKKLKTETGNTYRRGTAAAEVNQTTPASVPRDALRRILVL